MQSMIFALNYVFNQLQRETQDVKRLKGISDRSLAIVSNGIHCNGYNLSKQCMIAINAANTIPLFDTCCIIIDIYTAAIDITIARIEPTSVLLSTAQRVFLVL